MQIHMVNYMLRKAKKESRVSTLTGAQIYSVSWFNTSNVAYAYLIDCG